jgi:hypothetical protein
LIHASVQDAEALTRSAGELTGMAQDQNTTMIEVDELAREDQAQAYAAATTTASTSTTHGDTTGIGSGARSVASAAHRGPVVPPERRRLRDIVQDSTERWLLPTDQAEQEYFSELRAMGYEADQLEARKHERGREYHDMLERGCKRAPQFHPVLIPHLPDYVRVVSVSAGYAHTVLLTDIGHMYAAGYNDRGQLGLGHRINTSVFKLVEQLSNKRVLEVSCGQQHTICRVRGAAIPTTTATNTKEGGDVYTFGNGVLGQLGHGRLGTTRGAMVPTLVKALQDKHPSGIISVGAGANFSAVVSEDGTVYSFGHAEYNQHGTGHNPSGDYIDPFYFFTPRKVPMPSTAAPGAVICSVSCGSTFTVAADTEGNMYSWGWNEGGVLGHGTAHFSAAPQLMNKIGAVFDHCRVLSMCTGSSHAVALAESNGNLWASAFTRDFEDAAHGDCRVICAPATHSSDDHKEFYCNRAVLCARSKYLAGCVRAAERELREHARVNCRTDSEPGTTTKKNGSSSGSMPLITLDLSHSASATPFAVSTVLEYIFTDRVRIPFLKRKEVHSLACELRMERLSLLLMQQMQSRQNPILAAQAAPAAAVQKERFESTFVTDFLSMLNSSEHADVYLVRSCASLSAAGTSAFESSNPCATKLLTSMPSLPPHGAAEDGKHKIVVMKTHSVMLRRIPYFAALLDGEFGDSMQRGVIVEEAEDTPALAREVDSSCTVRVVSQAEQQQIIEREGFEHGCNSSSSIKRLLDLEGLAEHGIDTDTFRHIIIFAYVGKLLSTTSGTSSEATPIDGGQTGEEHEVDLNMVMKLLVAANWLSFVELEKLCERIMSLHLRGYFPTNAENCLDFARAFQFTKLERRCEEVLRRHKPADGAAHAAAAAILEE